MIVELIARNVYADFQPGRWGPGKTFLFSDNMSWQKIDGRDAAGRAGTHSGSNRVLRAAEKGDGVLPEGLELLEYEATYALDAKDAGGKHLDAGQLTARGVWYLAPPGVPLPAPFNEPLRVAITGGTGQYATARGFITHSAELDDPLDPDPVKKIHIHTLDIR